MKKFGEILRPKIWRFLLVLISERIPWNISLSDWLSRNLVNFTNFTIFFEIKTTIYSWYWAVHAVRTLSKLSRLTYALSQLIYWVSKTKTFQFTLICKKKGQCLNCENRVNPRTIMSLRFESGSCSTHPHHHSASW